MTRTLNYRLNTTYMYYANYVQGKFREVKEVREIAFVFFFGIWESW